MSSGCLQAEEGLGTVSPQTRTVASARDAAVAAREKGAAMGALVLL